jgi:3-oxoacyl-[acyl-carrier protein] reductase
MQSVLMTGASRGIGKAIFEKFTSEGYCVVAPTREQLDLSEPSSIDDFVGKNKDMPIDIIVNCAAINPIAYIEDIEDIDFDKTMQVNIKAPLKLIQGFVGGMKSRGYGRIVNISSIWGVVSKEKRTTYSVSKNGIHGISNALAVELGEYNILINSVCPGFTNTELTLQNVSPIEATKLCEQIPLGRFAEPSEIAELVFFLGSSKNTYITGQKIVIDGGFVAK